MKAHKKNALIQKDINAFICTIVPT